MVVPVEVCFRDTDAMGHANNAVYLTWLENARIGYWRRMVGPSANYAEVPFVLARAEIDYREPVYAGERLEVGVRLARVGNRSFDLRYRIARVGDGALVAEAKTVQVMYDYRARRSMPMPAEFRAGLLAIDGEPEPAASAAGAR